MTPEAKASEAVELRLAAWRCRAYRNNSGVLPNPETGVPVRFGLGNESPKFNKQFKTGDLVGWVPLDITQEMVGQRIAVFMNIEVKAEGFKPKTTYNPKTREWAQDKFNKLVIKHGGVAGFATNENDVDLIIYDFLNRIKS